MRSKQPAPATPVPPELAVFLLLCLSSGDCRIGLDFGPHPDERKNPHAAADSPRMCGSGLPFR